MSRELDLMIRHDHWANARVISQMLEHTDLPAKSVGWMCHIIGAQHIWISRIHQTAPTYDVFPTIDRSRWMKEITENKDALIAILQNRDLDEVITYHNTKGVEFRNPIREILLHLSLHSQYHRGQIVTHNKSIIADPLPTDMIFFLREKP